MYLLLEFLCCLLLYYLLFHEVLSCGFFIICLCINQLCNTLNTNFLLLQSNISSVQIWYTVTCMELNLILSYCMCCFYLFVCADSVTGCCSCWAGTFKVMKNWIIIISIIIIKQWKILNSLFLSHLKSVVTFIPWIEKSNISILCLEYSPTSNFTEINKKMACHWPFTSHSFGSKFVDINQRTSSKIFLLCHQYLIEWSPHTHVVLWNIPPFLHKGTQGPRFNIILMTVFASM